MTDNNKEVEDLPTAARYVKHPNLGDGCEYLKRSILRDGDELVRRKDVVKMLNQVHEENVPIPDEADNTDYWRGFTHALAFVMEKTCGKRETPVELEEVESDE